MAGEPHSYDAVQAAVLKSAAGRAGQGDPADAVIQGNTAAIKQDLSVMANQAGKYAAGVTAGALQAQEQAASTERRLVEARAQQDQARADEQQMLELRRQEQAASAAQRIAEIQAAAAARGSGGGGGGGDEWEQLTMEDARQVSMDYLTRADQYTGSALADILQMSASPNEARALLTARRRQGLYNEVDDALFNTYVGSYFNALGGGGVTLPDQATLARGKVLAVTRGAVNMQREREAQPGYVNKSKSLIGKAKAAANKKRK